MKRKLLLVALCAGLCSLTVFAAYPNGTITWEAVSVAKDEVKASGSYTVDNGWTADSVTLQVMNKDGGLIRQYPGSFNNGKWDAGRKDKADTVPNGTYVAWVILIIKSNGQPDRGIAATLKTGLQ